MKIEVEIDEQLIPALAYAAMQAPADEDVVITVSRGAANVIRRYASQPEVVTEKHTAALALARQKAAELASAGMTDRNGSVEAVADRVLDFILYGR